MAWITPESATVTKAKVVEMVYVMIVEPAVGSIILSVVMWSVARFAWVRLDAATMVGIQTSQHLHH